MKVSMELNKKVGISCNYNYSNGALYWQISARSTYLLYKLKRFDDCLYDETIHIDSCVFCPLNPFHLKYNIYLEHSYLDFKLYEVKL